MKKILACVLFSALALLGFKSMSFAQRREEMKLTVTPAFFLLDGSKLAKFNETVSASGNFKPFEQKVFSGIAFNTTAPLKNSDFWLGSNTLIALAVSTNEEQTLTYSAAGITISLERFVRPADKLRAGYGGMFGYGVSSVLAQFEKDATLDEQLGRARYSQANQFYLLAGLKGEIDYQITEQISLTCQAQYLLPIGSLGTKAFDLPLSGPNVQIGTAFDLPLMR